jgi:hypothetical protein
MGLMNRERPEPIIKKTARIREDERASLERAVSAYYDSLSREEAEEQMAWSEFAVLEFSNRET